MVSSNLLLPLILSEITSLAYPDPHTHHSVPIRNDETNVLENRQNPLLEREQPCLEIKDSRPCNSEPL